MLRSVQKRVVGGPSYKMNVRPPFPPVIRTLPPIILDWAVRQICRNWPSLENKEISIKKISMIVATMKP